MNVDRNVPVAARWEAQMVYIYADPYRQGVLPSDRDTERLALACERLTKGIRAMVGDGQVSS